MAKTLFKGIQQVTWEYFNSPDLDKKGYLWFVREPQGENTGLGDDKFHIYFGTRCYGSFWEGEHEALAASLSAIKDAVGLGDDFAFTFEDATTVVEAFELVRDWYDALETRVGAVETGKADKTELVKFVDGASYADKTITFKNGETELFTIDATPFIKDGMLSDVEVVVIEKDDEGNIPEGTVEGEKYIKFTWNTDGEEKVDYVLASEIGATYAAGEGIAISEDNVVSVSAVTSSKVNVTEIPVGGTPLANLLLENDITSIEAGNLQAVLEALFSQNNWATGATRNIPTALTVSMDNPTITFTLTATTVEVGTEITVTASASTASASATLSYSGFEYGYSVENDNTRDAEGNPDSVSVTGTKDTDSNYKLTFTTNNGFSNKKLAEANAQNISSVEGYDNKVIVAEGSNKITVTATSPTFSGTVPAQNAVYACSSLKKTDESHVVAASSASTITGAVITKTNSDSVTGAYYAFVGFADAIPSNDDFRKAIGNGFTRLGKGAVAAGTCNKTYMYVCVPSGWDFTCNTSLGSDMRGSFTDTGDATITLPNDDTKAYKYYALTYKDGAFKDLVIK